MLDLGSLGSGLLTGLREGVEAALIVSILCAYLARTGNGRHFDKVWAGVAAAIAVSVVAGIVIFLTIGGLQEPYEQIFEGVVMLAAAGVVTWMLFWMRRQASAVRGELQRAVDRALTDGAAWGLGALAFTAVIREGLETSIFLVGQTQAAAQEAGGNGPASVIVGAVLGLLVAVVLGYGFYRGSRVLNLPRFFRWTGILLIFIAAGLVSAAVHEFVEIGWITFLTQTAFDISAILPSEEGIGRFLRALFGYSSQPELVTLVVWLTYVIAVLASYLRPLTPQPVGRREPAAGAGIAPPA